MGADLATLATLIVSLGGVVLALGGEGTVGGVGVAAILALELLLFLDFEAGRFVLSGGLGVSVTGGKW